jgi:hypothetical protein
MRISYLIILQRRLTRRIGACVDRFVDEERHVMGVLVIEELSACGHPTPGHTKHQHPPCCQEVEVLAHCHRLGHNAGIHTADSLQIPTRAFKLSKQMSLQ